MCETVFLDVRPPGSVVKTVSGASRQQLHALSTVQMDPQHFVHGWDVGAAAHAALVEWTICPFEQHGDCGSLLDVVLDSWRKGRLQRLGR